MSFIRKRSTHLQIYLDDSSDDHGRLLEHVRGASDRHDAHTADLHGDDGVASFQPQIDLLRHCVEVEQILGISSITGRQRPYDLLLFPINLVDSRICII